LTDQHSTRLFILLTMRTITLVLACLACAGNSQRKHARSLRNDERDNSAGALARRLLALRNPAASWQVAAPFGRSARQAASRHVAVSMQAPTGAQPPPRRVSRRSFVLLPLALAALGAPKRALAKTSCTCPAGPESCVCEKVVDDDVMDNRIGPLTEAGKLDYAAADAKLGVSQKQKSNSIWFGRALENTEPVKNPSFLLEQTVDYIPDLAVKKSFFQVEAERQDKSLAKQKFAKVIAQTVAQREKELGITFNDADIAQLADALKPKYCGKDGQFGRCS